ncbi:NADP-dependent oxidoreductase [Mycobacterium sp. KBS0706]|uniref:NADP-dependent oxidoreductase n=1 Tax=Mycobacterium sp. KBS0706 TaxID=2578109 RepID=UPI00110F983B|nr:NADP-dependent oxidoreductase [Mycobacterium sp. KBS0706]TSD85034.1 NADP-dependent oxidoreductase [Mycobacterium sp. KBS0706]
MKASRVHRFGSPEVIAFEDVERPEPGEGEVLVRVAAAGVGPWDGWIRAGKSVLPQPLPLTLGSDLSGTVEATGPGATGFAPGDEVFGVTNARFTGAYAEYALASAAMIARKPGRIGHVEAASLPVVAVTAWQALFEQTQLGRTQTVLVLGGAGNVGAYAVQIAHRAGARVIATASAADLAYLRSLGADEVVDRKDRLEDRVELVDAVIDLVGGEAQSRSFAVLKRGGRLVSAVSQPDQQEAARRGVTAGFFLVQVTTAHLERIAAMVDAGELAMQISSILPLTAARAAHEMLEGARPHPRGKIILQIGS